MIAVALVAGALEMTQAKAADTPRDALRDESPEDQKAVAGVLQQLFDAARQRDVDRVEALHYYGPKFSKYDDSGPRQDGAAARASERQTLARVRSYAAKADGVKIDVFGAVAIARFIFDYSVTTDQSAVSGKARSTLVFAKDGKRWRIVHEHHSPVTPER